MRSRCWEPPIPCHPPVSVESARDRVGLILIYPRILVRGGNGGDSLDSHPATPFRLPGRAANSPCRPSRLRVIPTAGPERGA